MLFRNDDGGEGILFELEHDVEEEACVDIGSQLAVNGVRELERISCFTGIESEIEADQI